MDQIKLRKYNPDDYNQVVQIYQDGIKEVNKNAYQSFYNGLFPQLIISEIVAFIGGYCIGFYSLDIGYFGSFICGTISLAILCCISLWFRREWTDSWVR